MSMFFLQDQGDGGSIWDNGSSLFNISSPLNDLLEQGDFTLEDLLQEDELIQEVKSKNQKLIDYLSSEESLDKLIGYVVTPVDETADELRKYKYPYMSCEVVCCDIGPISETLATAADGTLLEKVFTLLHHPAPLDPRLAGYFEKIMSLLMARKSSELISVINKNSEELLEAFIRHIGSYPVAETFKHLLQSSGSDFMDGSMDFGMGGFGFGGIGMNMGMGMLGGYSTDHSSSNYFGENGEEPTIDGKPPQELLWMNDENLIQQLVTSLLSKREENDLDIYQNIGEVLVNLVKGSPTTESTKSTKVTQSTQLVAFMEKKEIVETLLSIALPSDKETVPLTSTIAAISVLNELIYRQKKKKYKKDEEEVPVCLSSILKNLPHLVSVLTDEDKNLAVLINQQQIKQLRVGFRRLKFVGLINSLIQCKCKAVDNALIEQGVLSVCIDLFFKYDLCNKLHHEIANMVSIILEGSSYELLHGLFSDAKIIEKILNAYNKNEASSEGLPGKSKGYMGHLHVISEAIVKFIDKINTGFEKNESLIEMTERDELIEFIENDSSWSKWQEFVNNTLSEVLRRESTPLGGVRFTQNEQLDSQDYEQSDFNINNQLPGLYSSGFSIQDDVLHGSGFDGLAEVGEDSSSDEDMEYNPDDDDYHDDDDDYDPLHNHNEGFHDDDDAFNDEDGEFSDDADDGMTIDQNSEEEISSEDITLVQTELSKTAIHETNASEQWANFEDLSSELKDSKPVLEQNKERK